MDEVEIFRRSEADAIRVRAQLMGLEQMLGVKEGFAAQIFGESRTRFESGQRQTVNRIYADGTIFTVFHEGWHGFRREARATGRITRQEEIAFLRMLDGVMAGKKDKSGRPIRFLPEGIADDAVTDVQIDEAMSELAEAEILRTRQAHKSGVMEVPAGLVTRHMKALVASNARVANKFRAFFEAARAHFGLAMKRSVAMEKGFRDGTLDRAKYDEHLRKVLGKGDRRGEADAEVDLSRLDEGWDGAAFSAENGGRLDRPPSRYSFGRENGGDELLIFENAWRRYLEEDFYRKSLEKNPSRRGKPWSEWERANTSGKKCGNYVRGIEI